jgi:hypothetical protein
MLSSVWILGFRMGCRPFTRSALRDSIVGALVAAALLGLTAVSHAQVGFWQRLRPDGRDANGNAEAGMAHMVMRAERQDHVRAQIERMEARARADERLSGRARASANRDEERERNRRQERAGPPDGARAENRPGNVGPGWQAHDRDSSR